MVNGQLYCETAYLDQNKNHLAFCPFRLEYGILLRQTIEVLPLSMPDILLTTITARYAHCAFGLRWLWANLGDLRANAQIREFHLKQPPLQIAEALLAEHPKIIGAGAYIWNIEPLTQVFQTIKSVRPEITIVIGGPEASFEYENTALFRTSDYLVRGEGEAAFAALTAAILTGNPPDEKVITAEPPDLAGLAPPYDAYSEADLSNRILYVEASRGCPFRCEFCMSSLDAHVRDFPLEPFLAEMQRLLDRGARHFTFVDRTFNLRQDRVDAILDFFLKRWRNGMRLHFEIVPDRLSAAALERIALFPPGGLHLEVGVQTFNPETQAAISRRQNLEKTVETLHFLRTKTGALLHADLVAGMPLETWESFADGFNRLITLDPHKIQIGILKRLKGAPIIRHEAPYAMAFAKHPPYEILQTDRLTFEQLQRIKRFARYFDLFYNNGNFPATLPLLWRARATAFDAFMDLSDSLWESTGRTHEFPLPRLARHLCQFLISAEKDSPEHIRRAITEDYHRVPGRTEKLELPQ